MFIEGSAGIFGSCVSGIAAFFGIAGSVAATVFEAGSVGVVVGVGFAGIVANGIVNCGVAVGAAAVDA